MFQSLELFRTSGAMAAHAGQRQATFARNLAHADTPGYRASYIPPFREAYRTAEASSLRASRPGHTGADGAMRTAQVGGVPRVEPSPNGNAVSVELEMLNGVEAAREHNRALAIYRHGMTVIRATLAR